MATLALNNKNENIENAAFNKSILPPKTSAERKSLKTLQVGSDGKITGLENKKGPLKKFPVLNKPVKVFVDKKRTWLEMGTQTDTASLEEREAQTEVMGDTRVSTSSDVHNDSGVAAGDIDQEAYDLMVKEPIPEYYWRDLAEERRCSLAEALSENEMLHQSMEELKEENQNLSLLASQAEYLASVLNDVLGEKTDEDNKNDETGPENEDKNTDTEQDTEQVGDKKDESDQDNDEKEEPEETQVTDTDKENEK